MSINALISWQPIDLSPGDLLYYGGVEWLNISDFLGKIKKGLELHAMCFVFKSAVVFLCKERLRQKKKLMVSVHMTHFSISILVTLLILKRSSRLPFFLGRFDKGQLKRGRDHPLPSADPGDRSPGQGQFRQGYGVPLLVGADSSKKSITEEIGESICALQQVFSYTSYCD